MKINANTKAETKPHEIKKWLGLAIFMMALLLVLPNIFTHLRLNNDALRYLGILEYIKGGLDKTSDAAHDFLPHGYPMLLFLFDRLHFLSPFSITLINILSVLTSSYILTKILTIDNKLFYYGLVLLSSINIKHFTLPVADQFFTLMFITAIYLWTIFFKGRLYFVIPAVLVTVLSIYVRTAGIAIIPGLICYLIYLNRGWLIKNKLLISIISLFGIALLIIFVGYLTFFEKKVDYLRQLELERLFKTPSAIIERLLIHFKELGEVVINLPYSKLSGLLNTHGIDIAGILLVLTGILSLFIYYKTVKYLKLLNSLSFWVFVSYLSMIFIWPFYDTRFLIPIIPLFIFLLFYYLFSIIKNPFLKCVPIAIYLITGIISVSYSDMLSLNKPFFLSHYGVGSYLADKYRIHFQYEESNEVNKPATNIKKDYILYILDEYDRKPLYHQNKSNVPVNP